MRDWKPALRRPAIYAFTTPDRPGQIKVGETSRDVHVRIQEILRQAVPDPTQYQLLLEHPAITPDGMLMKDHHIHMVLEHHLGRNRHGRSEWFDCSIEDVKAAIKSVETGSKLERGRAQSFGMRPEQKAAVRRAADYFRQHAHDKDTLRFLWNAKMRFGKTFSSYKLAQEMGWSKVLILTYKPAVEDSWRKDLESHADFTDWSFVGNRSQDPEFSDKTIWFSSFQALFPRDKDGPRNPRLNKIFETQWDAIILDEYHFGAWNDKAAELMRDDDKDEEDGIALQARVASGEAGISTNHILHLSGTPFRALNTGEFNEDQIFNWTYTDEQRAKENWDPGDGNNPYELLPRMVMMTYKLPDGILEETDDEELNLDKFFAAEKLEDPDTKEEIHFFKNDYQVRLWLDFITGTGTSREEFQEDEKSRSPMPFKDAAIFPYINHSFWYMPSVSACNAMADLLREHSVMNNYEVVVAAGVEAGIGIDALPPVREAIANNRKTITLSCGKLTTGVTVPEWTAVFMLRSMKSPESYFQTAFRAQSPGTVMMATGKKEPSGSIKDTCFLFDFDPRRALTLASQYCYQLDEVTSKDGPSKASLSERMREFLDYLPVLCHDNGIMLELDPGAAIELATSGTGTAMLARRFQSPRMVDLNYAAIERMQEDSDLVEALQKIESFRNLSKDLDAITAEHKKKGHGADDEGGDGGQKDKKPSKIDPAIKKLMKEIRDNLLKFITRLPVFMYLNDERERTALEVIETTDDVLFKKATGITKADFRKLLDLGVFNAPFMNETIRSFKQVEDNALVYLGDRVIDGTHVAAWDTYVERV